MVIVAAGRRIDAPGASPRRFPLEHVDLVRQRLRLLLRTSGATTFVSSAANGADLLALSEARAAGLRCRVVLPFDRTRFLGTSVTDRPGDWEGLYTREVAAAEAAGDLVTLRWAGNDEAAYLAATLAMLDEAAALARPTGEAVSALLIWDGRTWGEGDATQAFGQAAQARGYVVQEIYTLRTCFVVQGFGEKTDFTTGRVLNLDASYDVIREAVEDAGLRCVRADEIMHTGTIDVPMYEWLYKADLVIADLSTYNVNAAYELGVRYGLRPQTTLIVAESQFKNPFDVGHIVTLPYEHLGKDVGRREAQRFKQAIAERIRAAIGSGGVDSPVYTFLPLRPPSDERTAPDRREPGQRAAAAIMGAPGAEVEQSAKDLLQQARDAHDRGSWLEAKALFKAIHRLRPNDEYVVQQLALTTYKSRSPDPVSALQEARGYLMQLRPESTNDPETLALWGAVHKRMWDESSADQDLNEAVAGYERGFYVRQDHYNGINYAFLLNVRADRHQRASRWAEAVADFVTAQRVRRDVLRLCERALAAGPTSDEARYWILATQWEAAVGLADAALEQKCERDARTLDVAGWMRDSTQMQVARLRVFVNDSPLDRLPLAR